MEMCPNFGKNVGCAPLAVRNKYAKQAKKLPSKVMYVYMCVCIFCLFVRLFVCMHACVYVCIFVCMYICMYVYIFLCVYVSKGSKV